MRARVFAILSALASLIYLGGILSTIIMLFVSWRIALLIAIGLPIAAISAKWLDRAKLRCIYGDDAGNHYVEKRWEQGLVY